MEKTATRDQTAFHDGHQDGLEPVKPVDLATKCGYVRERVRLRAYDRDRPRRGRREKLAFWVDRNSSLGGSSESAREALAVKYINSEHITKRTDAQTRRRYSVLRVERVHCHSR